MIRALLRNAGIHPHRWWSALRGCLRYVRDRRSFRAMASPGALPWGRELPMFEERHEAAGSAGAYFFQDQIAARWVHEGRPVRHVDIGSRIDGFIGHLTVFREVEVMDLRPMPIAIPGVRFHQFDLMQEIPAEWVEATDSLSCLHTIEHFGLGRYGDQLDPDGHLKGLAQLKRMVASGGRLILSTPVGHERVEFNAHRVFSPATMLSWFADGWTIEKSAVIDDELRVCESSGAEALRGAECQTGVGLVCARKR